MNEADNISVHRSLAVLLILMLCISLPLSSLAEEGTSGDYRYILLEDGTAEITAWNGNAVQLVIPSALDGHSVTGIGAYAFSLCDSLKDVTIPDSVKSIGDAAFYLCENLTSVTIPGSVASIGEKAFDRYPGLTATVGRDSYAEQYCIDNGIPYTYFGSPEERSS